MGILGGIGTHPEDLLHMKRTADRLFGDAYRWSVLGAGRHQVPLTTQAAMIGSAGVRVGLEDSIYLRRGVLAESNAAQVERTVRILDELSLEPATPDEAREILGLKGAGEHLDPGPGIARRDRRRAAAARGRGRRPRRVHRQATRTGDAGAPPTSAAPPT